LEERISELARRGDLTAEDIAALKGDSGLTLKLAEHMIENVVGLYPLPLGIALNFMVNGRDVLIPMAVEEPSIVAGASFMAKLVRVSGGFIASTTPPEMIGQMQILDIADPHTARLAILGKRDELLAGAADYDPVLKKLGGGPRDIEVRIIDQSPIGSFLVIHLIYDVRDAMGANAVNTACERLTPQVEEITGGRVHLRILSNLADRRLARACCTVPLESLAFRNFTAEDVRDGIIAAWAFAASDPYRAATHNKGIMNGVDAVVVATGNDWRAIEAGAHAYAARGGTYTSLSTWGRNGEGDLVGTLEMPMAVGIVGGATRVHPVAQIALKLMGVSTAHMNLHARQVAIAAGADGDNVTRLARQLVAENAVRIDRALEIMKTWSPETP
jgi:hydroxymethylglutaryl-CoA reductase